MSEGVCEAEDEVEEGVCEAEGEEEMSEGVSVYVRSTSSEDRADV